MHDKYDNIKGKIKIMTAAFAVLLTVTGSFCTAYGVTTEQKIRENAEEIESLKEQQEEAEADADRIEEEKNGIEEKMSGLNDNLSILADSIESLNVKIVKKEDQIEQKQDEIMDKLAEIDAKREEIKEAEAALQEAVDDRDRQYEDMKKRIRFMYENGRESMIMSLLSQGSISSFLSKVEYISDFEAYDRSKMEEYKQSVAECEAIKSALEEEEKALVEQQSELREQETSLKESKQELKSMERETEEKKDELSNTISATQEDLKKSEEALEDAKLRAEALQKQIDEALALEAELEKKKAAEDAARLEEYMRQESENTGAPVVINSATDRELLAAIIYCEAGNQTMEGKLAVACVVMNRVRSSHYPNTVSGVIYQANQFTPVTSGRFATVLANGMTTDECRQAADTVLAGNLPYPNYLSFRSYEVPGATRIDGQWFF